MAELSIPGYEIQSRIGAGGMATVYKARQLSLDRVVAIKVLSRKALTDAEALARFRHEARIAAQLTHPSIVQVFDAGETDGYAYYVMEFIDGWTLGDLLRKQGALAEKHALKIALGIAKALSYAWDEAHLIHCDVKPDNIMIDREGRVKLADLGLAMFAGRSAGQKPNEWILTTPNYASPEQARGESNLDCRTDIYSLGATLYHAITGRLPFGELASDLVLEQQLAGFLPDPVELVPHLSPACAILIARMMAKDRAHRQQLWNEVVADLIEVSAGRQPGGEPPVGEASTVRLHASLSDTPPSSSARSAQSGGARPAQTPGGARRTIVVSRSSLETAGQPQKRKRDYVRALSYLLLLIAALVVASMFVPRIRERVKEAAERAEAEEEARHEAELADLRIRTAPPEYQRPTPAEPASEPTNEPATNVTVATAPERWDSAAFREGARLFNEALGIYSNYLAQRDDRDMLRKVEERCRAAITNFEGVRATAPEHLNVSNLITQCFRLIEDARQVTILEAKKVNPLAHLFDPSAPRTPQPAGPRTIEPVRPVEKKQLKLSPDWKAGALGDSAVWKALFDLLNPLGQPGENTDPDPLLILLEPITYLMPAADAAGHLNQPLGDRLPVRSPVLPQNSFFYYTLAGKFTGGFEQMLLIADRDNQVVGMALISENPGDPPRLAAPAFNSRWRAYDLVRWKTDETGNMRIGCDAQRVTDRLVRIDTELLPRGGADGLKTAYRVRLLLHLRIVNLILLRLQGGG